MYKRKILITGGAGFIGSSLAERLVKDAENLVIIVDNLFTGFTENIPESEHDNCRFVKCDVNNYYEISQVMQSTAFDFVFHYAAVVGVKRTLANPVTVLDDIQGIKNILDLSKNTGVKRVFYASSSEIYGESVEFPQNETSTPLNSRLPYAVVKNIGEAYLKSYKQEYGIDFTIFRFFNTYGAKQTKDFVVSKFIRAAKNNEPITIYGDGLQTRTFCYVDDNISAALKCLYEDLYINDVINIGNDIEISILRLAEVIKSICNSQSEIIAKEMLPEGDMMRRLPDVSKMKELLNRDLVSLEAGLDKIIKVNNLVKKEYV